MGEIDSEDMTTLRKDEERNRRLDVAWKHAKKELYYWNRLLAIAKRKVPKNPPKKNAELTSPNWKWPQAEDVPQRLDLKSVLDQHLWPSPNSERTRAVAICAEDPGVRVRMFF